MAPGSTPTLVELSRALGALHKALLDAELDNFPMARSSGERLTLVVEHPSFAWLHALSELIVEIDQTADDGVPGPPPTCRAIIERLIGPAPPSHAAFRNRYLEHLQLAPEVAIATGTVRGVLARLQTGG